MQLEVRVGAWRAAAGGGGGRRTSIVLPTFDIVLFYCLLFLDIEYDVIFGYR